MKKRMICCFLLLVCAICLTVCAQAEGMTPSLTANGGTAPITVAFNEEPVFQICAPGATAVRLMANRMEVPDDPQYWMRTFDRYEMRPIIEESGMKMFDTGTWLVTAEYTTEEYPDGTDLLEAELDWVPIGSGITVEVQNWIAQLAPPSVTISPGSVEQGEPVLLTLGSFKNVNEWYWCDLERYNGEDWEYLESFDTDFAGNGGNTFLLSTMGLDPGEYRIWSRCEAVGYEDNGVYLPFTVTEREDPQPAPVTELSRSFVQASQDIEVYAGFPGADRMQMDITRDGEPNWHDRRDGEGEFNRWTWSVSEAGTYMFALKAWQGDVMTEAEPVVLTVTSPNGWLEAPVAQNVPGTLAAGTGINGSFTGSENAEYYHIDLVYCRDDGDWETLFSAHRRSGTAGCTALSFPGSLFTRAGIYQLMIHAGAQGWNSGHLDLRFLVTESLEEAMTLSVNGSTDDVVKTLSHEELSIEVDMPETVTALRILNDDHWDFFDAEDFRRDGGVDWMFGRGTRTIIAQGTQDAAVWREDGFAWDGFDPNCDLNWTLTSNGVQVVTTAPNGALEAPEVTVAQSVARGEWLTGTIEGLDLGEQYWARIAELRTNEDSDSWFEDVFNFDVDSGNEFAVPTAMLESGEYYVVIDVYAVGWEGRTVSAPFTVTEPDEPLPAARLYLPQGTALTSRDITFYAFAPGADWMTVDIGWMGHGGWEDRREDGGEWFSARWSVSDSGTYVFTLHAWNGDELIGTDEQTLEVSAPYGDLDAPVLQNVPGIMPLGTSIYGTFAVDEHAGEYHVQLHYCPPDQDWELLEESFRCAGEADMNRISFAGELFDRVGNYRLEIHAHSEGWNGGHIDHQIFVTPPIEENISLTVNGMTGEVSLLSQADFRVEASLPEEATAVRLLFGDHWEFFDVLDFNGVDWSFGRGEYTVLALATDADPVWRAHDFDWGSFDWDALDWNMMSNGILVKVTSPYGTLAVPTLQVPESAARGDWIPVTIGEVEGAQRYALKVIHRDENGNEDDHLLDRRWESAGAFTLPTQDMQAGETYWVTVWAEGEGYDSGESEAVPVAITSGSETACFRIDPEEVVENGLQTYEIIALTVHAPGADFVRLVSNGELMNEGEGDLLQTKWLYDQPDDCEVRAIATYDQFESWVVIGEPVFLHVTAPNGALEAAIDAPVSIAGDGTAEFTVTWRHGGIPFYQETMLYNQDWVPQPLETVSITEGEAEDVGVFRVQGSDLVAGETYCIECWVSPDAVGYQTSRVLAELTVETGNQQGTVTVSHDEVLRGEEVDVTVDVPGATALKVYHGENQWEGFIGSRVEASWRFGQVGDNHVYALYTTETIGDPENVDFESLHWQGMTPVASVRVTSLGKLSRPDVTLESEIVRRGQPFRIAINSLQGLDEWYIGSLRDDEQGREIAWSFWDEDSCTIRVETLDVEPGLYYLAAINDAVGYESYEVKFFVAVEEPAEGLTVSLPDSPVRTQDTPTVTAYAPGAERITLTIVNLQHPDHPAVYTQDGEMFRDDDVLFGERAGTRHVIVTAEFADAEPQTFETDIEVVAPYGDRPHPTLHMSQRWIEDEDLDFRVDAGSALYVTVDILDRRTGEYVYEDEDLRFEDWNYSIPATVFTPGHPYSIEVYSTEHGYNADDTVYWIAMLPEHPDTLILPSGLTEIAEEAFAGVPAQKIVIPSGVTSVAAGAFSGCPNIIEVEIADGASGISADAFADAGAFVVYGAEGSDAEAYADSNSYATFICLD